MKTIRSFCTAGSSSALLIVLLMAGASMSAQQRSWQIIPGQSTASIFLGTAENQTSFDVGVARVSGELQLNSDDLSASRFNLTISSDRLENQKFFGRSIITFQSDTIEQRKDGELEVSGELTVTEAAAKGAGAQSAALMSADSRPMRTIQRVVFVFSGLESPEPTSNSGGSDVVPNQEEKPKSGMLVTANTSIDGDTFPELLFAVQDVAWPQAADGNNCGPTSAPGQDDSSTKCAGLTAQARPGGVDVRLQQEVPAGNLITIKFNLILASADSNSANNDKEMPSRETPLPIFRRYLLPSQVFRWDACSHPGTNKSEEILCPFPENVACIPGRRSYVRSNRNATRQPCRPAAPCCCAGNHVEKSKMNGRRYLAFFVLQNYYKKSRAHKPTDPIPD